MYGYYETETMAQQIYLLTLKYIRNPLVEQIFDDNKYCTKTIHKF